MSEMPVVTSEDVDRALLEIRQEYGRAVGHGMADHDDEHSPEVWVTKMSTQLGGAAGTSSHLLFRIYLLQLASLCLSAILAHDRKHPRHPLIDGVPREGATPSVAPNAVSMGYREGTRWTTRR